MNDKQSLEKVYIAQNIQDAYLVKSLLEENGIESFVRNENTSALAGLIPFGEVFPEVWVLEENSEEAKRIINEEYNEEPTDDVS